MKELIEIDNNKTIECFTASDGLQSVVDQVRDAVSLFEHDLSTGVGRKRTASLAAKVAKTKTTLDEMGKSLVYEMKMKCKTVDSSRKKMRDQLDEIKLEARRPLTEWEENEKRREAEEAARIEAERAAEQKENDHELAILLNEKYDKEKQELEQERKRLIAAEEAKAEAKRAEREDQIKREAAAKAEAEAKAAELAKIEAEKAKIEAEKRAIEAEKRAAEAAELAKIEALAAAEKAKQDEINRQAALKQAEAEEQARKEANKQHVGKVRKAAKESLMAFVDEATAKKIVLAINAGEISNITINY